MKKIISWLVSVCIISVCVTSGYSGGAAAAAEETRISSAEDFLRWINGGAAADAVLTDDIDLGNSGKFKPAALLAEGITLDGGGHRISGLNIDEAGEGALFLKNAGTVRNLITEGSVSAGKAAAVAVVNTGTVENVKNTASVYGSGTAAGIAADNRGYIINCENAGAISAADGARYIAGIAGTSPAGSLTGGEPLIRGCANFAGIGSEAGSAVFAGGICAYIGETMLDPDAPDSHPDEFSLETQKMPDIVHVKNARKLGGLKCGRYYIRDNALFRSAYLSLLSEEDTAVLSEKYNLRYIIDFRSKSEAEEMPDAEVDGAEYVSCPVYGSDLYSEETKKILPDLESKSGYEKKLAFAQHRIITEKYERVLLTESAREAYSEFFDILLSIGDDEAVIWHCTAGKDRTGIASALLLYALGADEDMIIRDYEISNEARAGDIEDAREAVKGMDLDEETMTEYIVASEGVDRKYLRLSFDSVRENYGSIRNYLNEGLGLSDEKIEALREKFLVGYKPASAAGGGAVSGSVNTGTVYGLNSSSGGACGVGGIAGTAAAGKTELAISDCVNSGSVIGDGKRHIGGIAGYCDNGISGCVNYGDIINTDAATDYEFDAGGIAGRLGSGAENVSNYGTVIAAVRVGGIAGGAESDISNALNCGTIRGNTDVGGIAGVIYGGGVYDSANTGEIHSVEKRTGGIAGSVDEAAVNGKIARCKNAGKIYGGECNIEGIVNFTGGIVGLAKGEGTVMEDVYNSGSVTAAYGAVGDISGKTTATVRGAYSHHGHYKNHGSHKEAVLICDYYNSHGEEFSDTNGEGSVVEPDELVERLNTLDGAVSDRGLWAMGDDGLPVFASETDITDTARELTDALENPDISEIDLFGAVTLDETVTAKGDKTIRGGRIVFTDGHLAADGGITLDGASIQSSGDAVVYEGGGVLKIIGHTDVNAPIRLRGGTLDITGGYILNAEEADLVPSFVIENGAALNGGEKCFNDGGGYFYLDVTGTEEPPSATESPAPYGYAVNDIRITDGGIIVDITKLTGGKAKLIAASYTDGGQLAEVRTADVSYSGAVDLDLNTEGASYIAAFIWNSLSDAVPISNRAEKDL